MRYSIMALAILCGVMALFIFANAISTGEVFVAAVTMIVCGSLLYGLHDSEKNLAFKSR